MPREEFIDHLHATERESIFTPIPKVPQSRRVVDRMVELWPRKGELLPESIAKFYQAQESYEWKEIWALENSNRVFVLANGLSSLYIGGIFRRALNLTAGGFAGVNIIMPSVIGSTIFGLLLHAKLAQIPMTLNPLGNHYATFFKSAGAHVFTSFWYPLMFTSFTSIYMASRNSTYAIPDDFVASKDSRRYLMNQIVRPTIRKSQKGLAISVLLNSLGAVVWTALEREEIRKLYFDMEDRVVEEAKLPPKRQVVIKH